jgi:membrane-associated PAP2 superfamily phosphatase
MKIPDMPNTNARHTTFMTTDAVDSTELDSGHSWFRTMATRRNFLLLHLAALLPIAALLFALEKTAIDATISGWFFDRVAGVFPLRHDGFLEVFAHQYTKVLVVAIACCVITLYLLSFVLPELKPQRRLLLFLALSLTLAPLAVVLLKAASPRYCPWSLLEYGGFAPHLAFFDTAPAGLAPGHCFPAGHASAGFSLMAFYFAVLNFHRPRLARIALIAGIAAGLALGLGRVAQGAHFVSHVLWSGLVCWLVIVALHGLILTRTG